LKREENAINFVKAIAGVIDDYAGIIKDVTKGGPKAIGAAIFEAGMLALPGGEEAGAARLGSKIEKVALDANVLMGALERGEKAAVVSAIGDSKSLIPITTAN
jgi:hypothetical protein